MSGSVLVDLDNERDMRLGVTIADVARGIAKDDAHIGMLLAIAVASHGKQAGLLETPEAKLKFAEGWGSMLGYAVIAVTSDDE